jgi:hypothetical protein
MTMLQRRVGTVKSPSLNAEGPTIQIFVAYLENADMEWSRTDRTRLRPWLLCSAVGDGRGR